MAIGKFFILLGMAIVPAEVRRMFVKMVMYHVPGGLTEAEKAEVRAAKAAWSKAQTEG
jgi:hypothetical protein